MVRFLQNLALRLSVLFATVAIIASFACVIYNNLMGFFALQLYSIFAFTVARLIVQKKKKDTEKDLQEIEKRLFGILDDIINDDEEDPHNKD